MQDRVARDLWRSAKAFDSDAFPLHGFPAWFDRQRALLGMRVEEIGLDAIESWSFRDEPRQLRHDSGRFFSVEGVRVDTDFGGTPRWEQPIVRQDEVGILGILTARIAGVHHFLLQVKNEPGNIDGPQLAPTVQATRSNYERVHRGTPTPYLDLFLHPGSHRVLVDQLQGEQGARYLRKRNRNMIVETDAALPVDDRYRWFTLGQVKRLLRTPNQVGMDTRSVLACVPPATAVREDEAPQHPMPEILRWLSDLRARYSLRLGQRPVDALENWSMVDGRLQHRTGRHFRVMGIKVDAVGREVRHWQQPILHQPGCGVTGFLVQRRRGTPHFLVGAHMHPGGRERFDLGPSFCRSQDGGNGPSLAAGEPPWHAWFRQPPAGWVRYSVVQSEEGGRFYRCQNRYLILEVPADVEVARSETHMWMTLGQIQSLVPRGEFNIEARNLLACLPADEAQDADAWLQPSSPQEAGP